MKSLVGSLVGGILLVQILIVSVIGIGWVKNVIKLTQCDFEAPYKKEAIHTAGLIPPVGMITGWMNIDD